VTDVLKISLMAIVMIFVHEEHIKVQVELVPVVSLIV